MNDVMATLNKLIKGLDIKIDVKELEGEEYAIIEDCITIVKEKITKDNIIGTIECDGYVVIIGVTLHSNRWDEPDDYDEIEIYRGEQIITACVEAIKAVVKNRLDCITESMFYEDMAEEFEEN